MEELKLVLCKCELNWINKWVNEEMKNCDKESNEYKVLNYLQVKVEVELNKNNNK